MPPPPIWNPKAEIPSSTIVRPCSYHHHPPAAACVPAQEAARMAALKRLRHKLVTQCTKHRVSKPPTLALERWLSRASLQRDLESGDTQQSLSSDPVLPSSGIADPGLIKDLSRTMPYDAAKSVAELLAQDAKTSAEQILKLEDVETTTDSTNQEIKSRLKKCTKVVKKASKRVQQSLDNCGSDNDDDHSLQPSLTALHEATQQLDDCRLQLQRMQAVAKGHNIVLDGSRRPGICDIALLQADGTRQKPYLTMSTSHLIKFVQLWQYTHYRNQDSNDHQERMILPKAIAQSPATTIRQMTDSTAFLQHLYCCLARYEMIKGAGYQCAMPPVAFDAACNQLGLGVTIECFASPFNCRYRQYCSAFADLEVPFGSLGSFFDDSSFFPTQGSFEANPPFVPESMYAMNDKLERLLANPMAKALSFLVIVPSWGAAGIGYVEQLESSTHCVAKSRVSAADHSFCDGAQHKALNQELRPSSWDTAVVMLQNEAGSAQWPVSQEQLDSAFCNALKKTKTKVSLTEWEGRGVGKGGSAKYRNDKRPHTAPKSDSFRGKKTKF